MAKCVGSSNDKSTVFQDGNTFECEACYLFKKDNACTQGVATITAMFGMAWRAKTYIS